MARAKKATISSLEKRLDLIFLHLEGDMKKLDRIARRLGKGRKI